MFRISSISRTRPIKKVSIPIQRLRRFHETKQCLARTKGVPRPPGGVALEIYLRNSAYGSSKKSSKLKIHGDKSRVNVVNESLCDDVLQRLAPSLQNHIGCDIIDVNPGVCLFSSKLHEMLKPRTHILMEPDNDLYSPFLQPLLNQPNSAYRLIPASGIIWSNLDLLETDNYLPEQTLFPPGDPRLEKKNDTLLFVANLGYNPYKPYMGFPSIAGLMVHQLMTAIRAHSIFQGYGLVRMLVWMGDNEKHKVLPRMMSYRRKFAVEAELACESIAEVAGSTASGVTNKREHGLDLEGARNVRNKMKKNNIITPANRKGELEIFLKKSGKKEENSSSYVERSFHKELRDAEERWARKEFTAFIDDKGQPLDIDPESKGVRRSKLKKNPQYERLKYLRRRKSFAQSTVNKLDALIVEYENIVDDLSKADGNISVEGKSEKDLVLERLEEWKLKIDPLSADNQSLIAQRLDDRRIFRQNPPVLHWDRREFEPLAVKADEFFPPGEMCLLDFHPRSMMPMVQGQNVTNYDYLEFILSGLFITPSQSVVKGLQAIAPGAAEWIIPRCPSLTDTTNGGSADLDRLTARSLNQQMIREILEAWMDWPFRPTKPELMARLGSQGIENDDDENWAGPKH